MARYEINHDGKIIEHDSALSNNLDNMVKELFSQYGWNAEVISRQKSLRELLLRDVNGNTKEIYVYCGNIRNEARSPYEKKIQLGSLDPELDPRRKDRETTIILGVYVFEENDGINDAIFVGYPIDDAVKYDSNPSIRGTFINQLLIDAKNKGFVYDKERNIVGFRSIFAFYYLDNHFKLHYSSEKFPEVVYDNLIVEENTDKSENKDINFETKYFSLFSRNRILFGAPGTGKSYIINKDRKELLGEDNETDYERVTFHPDYSYANFVGTYKPVMVDDKYETISISTEKDVLSVLTDNTKSAQEKYDLLYDKFKEDGLTRLPLLLGIYTDENFKTRKVDGSDAAADNSVERNHGRAIRPYVNLSKPVNSKKEISYEYVPGPFMRMYIKAMKNIRSNRIRPFLLIIEEINRANVAAVFGDIFQLLDRGENFVSEYPIQATEDIKKYLAKELGGNPDDYNKIRIPDNMFIWATMNSADQGVFPMDTAFKRRWDFTYIGIDDNDEEIRGKYVYLSKDRTQKVEWNKLRKAINNFLAKEKINEDKQLGPYFISKSVIIPKNGNEIDRDKFINTFKNKVIMYLFEDAARQKRNRLFEGCYQSYNRYSEICKEFESRGIEVFNNDIQIDCEVENLTTKDNRFEN